MEKFYKNRHENLKIFLMMLAMFMSGLLIEYVPCSAQTEPTLSERLEGLHETLLGAEINGDEVTIFLSETEMNTMMGISIMSRTRSFFQG